MEVYIACNTGYEEREFLGAFSTLDKATQYVSRKWGMYDDIIIYKHIVDSKDIGEMVYIQKTARIRN